VHSRVLLLSFGIFFSSLLAAGQVNGSTTKDPQAIQLIRQSIAVLDGRKTAALQDCTVRGSFSKVSNEGQTNIAKTFVWTVFGDEFRRETNGPAGPHTFISGYGRPRAVYKGTRSFLNYHVARAALPFHLPGLVLNNELESPNYTITITGNAVVNGKNTIHIHTNDDSDKVSQLISPQEWYIDTATLLPVRVEFRLPSNEDAGDYKKAAFEYLAFQPKEGLVFPVQLAYYEGDKLAAAVLIDDFSTHSDHFQSEFDLPQGDSAR
jgi:hypothetical protein